MTDEDAKDGAAHHDFGEQGQEIGDLNDDSQSEFRRRSVGFIFQFFNLLPTMTAWENVAVPKMLDWLRQLEPTTVGPHPDWPFVLSAGQRRLNNANQILRDPGTRASDPDGALYIHPQDLEALGVPDQGAIVVETAATVRRCSRRRPRKRRVRPCRLRRATCRVRRAAIVSAPD